MLIKHIHRLHIFKLDWVNTCQLMIILAWHITLLQYKLARKLSTTAFAHNSVKQLLRHLPVASVVCGIGTGSRGTDVVSGFVNRKPVDC